MPKTHQTIFGSSCNVVGISRNSNDMISPLFRRKLSSSRRQPNLNCDGVKYFEILYLNA